MTTRPPPNRDAAATAAAMAAVLSVAPSATAPKRVTGKSRRGMRGLRIRRMIASAASSRARSGLGPQLGPAVFALDEVAAACAAAPVKGTAASAAAAVLARKKARRSKGVDMKDPFSARVGG